MDIRIKILFIILLLWKIIGFFQNESRNIDEEIAEIERKMKFFSSEMQSMILNITKIIGAVIVGINILLLILSLKVIHGWMIIIPIISFAILNCDLTLFTSNTLKEYLHREESKNVKMMRVGYLIAGIAWYGMIIIS